MTETLMYLWWRTGEGAMPYWRRSARQRRAHGNGRET